jgi:hypothetical protein
MPHPLWVFKGAGVGSDLPALSLGQFSTARSNGTNKVIDTQGTFLVFLPVFAQSQLAKSTPAPRPLTPRVDSTPLIPTASGLFCAIDTLQLFCFQMLAHSFYLNGGVYPLASSSSISSLFLLFPEITQIREIRPSEASPLAFFTVQGSRVSYSFRINTCKSVSKQMTLTPFRMNTYEKTGGMGASPSIQNFIREAAAVLGCPTKVALSYSSPSVRGGRS